MKLALTYASSGFALVSAALWFTACFVSVRYKPVTDANAYEEAAFISDGADVIRTAKRQSYWNAWAAAVAGIAAVCQAVATALPDAG